MSQGQTSGFITAAVVGSLIGGAVGLFLAPKSGEEVREDLSDNYEKAHGLLNKLTGKECCAHCGKTDKYCSCFKATSCASGALLGIVIGVVAALLLAPKSGEKLREALGDKYEDIRDQAEDYIDTLNKKGKNAINQIEDWKETLADLVEKLSVMGKKGGSAKMNEIADWARFGAQIYKQYINRR